MFKLSVRQRNTTVFPPFQVSVPDLPRMEGRLLRGTAEFLAAASLLRSYFQPDLADHIPAILAGLKGHLLAASRGVETPDSPVPVILRYAATRIPRSELHQIIAHTFEGDNMIRTRAMKSAAEEWYEEGMEKGRAEGMEKGRAEGRAQGLLRGSLIGRIQLLQQLLERPIATDFQLDQLSNDALTTLLEDLRQQRSGQN
jgi:hypothetical protein